MEGNDPALLAPVVELSPEETAASPPGWQSWQCIAFRYLALHCLLYSLPRPFSVLVSLPAQGFGLVADPSHAPWSWFGAVAGALGEVETGWQWLTSGIGPWLGLEVIQQPTGSGDTAHDYAKLAAIVALSLLGTLLWTLIAYLRTLARPERARSYPVLGRWLHLFARWDLAFWLLSYGFIKLYASQFGEPGLFRLTREIGDTSPMGMVWTFMGASKPYEVFAGLGEVAGGLLLFHRRTALLGCLVSIGVMTNVAALNWLYDVPVKLFSSHLLLYAVFLLAPWQQRLWALVVTNRPSAPVDLTVVHSRRLVWTLALFGWLWVAGHLVQTHFGLSRVAEQRSAQRARPALYGLWSVERMLLDGVEVPATDATRWKFLAIDEGGTTWTRTASGNMHAFAHGGFVDGSVTMKPRSGGDEQTWTFESGTKTVQVADPEPRTMADFGKMVGVERRTLVLRGRWGDKQLELHTVEKVLLLQRGFRWVQEMPFNR